MDTISKKSLLLHATHKGKWQMSPKLEINNKYDLSLAYSPGVAAPCEEIHKNKADAYKYTNKGNMVAVVTDGSSVLGLGNIGPEAAIPVMEGKAILFKKFGGIDAVPICLDTQDPEEIIKICKAIAPSFGGINLEDIASPNCVTVETRLCAELDIPVFHDDQHGTAISVCAGILNSCKVVKKNLKDMTIAVLGTGAAGSSIIKNLHALGARDIKAFNHLGILHENNPNYSKYNFVDKNLINYTNKSYSYKDGSLEELLTGCDIMIGVSRGGIVTQAMVKKMKKDPIIFALANPTPEIMPEEAIMAGAKIVATGRSDYPNQINNVLVFPGLFKGALTMGAKKITQEMITSCIYAIANTIDETKLSENNIIPSPFDLEVHQNIIKAVSSVKI